MLGDFKYFWMWFFCQTDCFISECFWSGKNHDINNNHGDNNSYNNNNDNNNDAAAADDDDINIHSKNFKSCNSIQLKTDLKKCIVKTPLKKGLMGR